jgi:NTP pyrophosphatase (non-canonical NTP hydrolase)
MELPLSQPTLEELAAIALKFRDERDWKQFHNFKDMALSLVLESAELLELTQWKNGADLEQHARAGKQAIGEELSDILYWLLTIAHDLDIDLAEAFNAKIAKNAEKYPVEKARGSAKKYSEF